MKYFLLIISALTLLFSHKANSQSGSMIDLTKISVKEYVELLKVKVADRTHPFIVIEKNAPVNWITEKDLEYLISLLDSDEPSHCVMHYYSSHWPMDKSTIGGQAAELIVSYMLKEEYPHFLTKCSGTGQERNDAIKEWWAKRKK
jgi:hypothetical protein